MKKINLIKPVYAEKLGPLRGRGPLGLENAKDPSGALDVFTNVLSSIVGIMTIAAAIWFLINFITAAYQYMSAGGDNQKIKDAQQKIQNSFIGLFLVIAAVFVLSLFGALFDIPFLNIGEMFTDIINSTF